MRIRTYGVVRGVMLKHPPTRLKAKKCGALNAPHLCIHILYRDSAQLLETASNHLGSHLIPDVLRDNLGVMLHDGENLVLALGE